MIITIARQCGCGGHEVARILANKLGMELFDKKKLNKIDRLVYFAHKKRKRVTQVAESVWKFQKEAALQKANV